MSSSLADLNSRFALGKQLNFVSGPGGIAVVQIDSDFGQASIALQGGQVLAWTPRGHKQVFWRSDAELVPGKAIRAGVPLCWPWFGAHADEPTLPRHGYARTTQWTVERSQVSPDGSILLTLSMRPPNFPFCLRSVTLQTTISLGSDLRIDLITKNTGRSPVAIGEALHAYFSVSDVLQILVNGLADCHYIDMAAAGRRQVQAGPVSVRGEVDRVYINTTAECSIDDPGMGRRIRVKKSGSRSTIVWNPGAEKASALADFGASGFLGMICLESGNALENVVTVEPGGEHVLSVRYGVEAL